MSKLKRTVLPLIAILFCISLSGCARMRDARRPLAEHLENFEKDFLLSGSVEKQLAALYETSPQWQVFLESITYESVFGVGNKVEIRYTDTDIPFSEVAVAQSDSEIKACLARQMEKCPAAGAIVVTDSENKEPDISGVCDELQQEQYLTMMGFHSLECSFHSNSVTDDLIIKYRCEYSYPADKLREYRRQVKTAVKTLSASLWTDADDNYTRVRRIHDHIIDHTRYNTDRDSDIGDHTPYGVFVLGRSVCEGYTLAARLLLDAAGIENILVEGTGRDENHIWNMVDLDGRYYHLDVTWDDPVGQDKETDYKEYDFFLVSDKVMEKDHQWDHHKYPPAPDSYKK